MRSDIIRSSQNFQNFIIPSEGIKSVPYSIPLARSNLKTKKSQGRRKASRDSLERCAAQNSKVHKVYKYCGA